MDNLAKAMELRGYEVTICDLFSVPGEKDKERASVQSEDVQQLLESQIGRHYDAVIDFNSLLPRMENEEGIPYPDLIKAPFYNYIVDHPLYHHPALVRPLQNYHVICLDEDHKRYIEENYPHIRSVQVLPLGAVEAAASWKKAKDGGKVRALTFLGTYIPSADIMKQIDALPGKLCKELHGMIEVLETDPDLPVDQGFLRLYPEYENTESEKLVSNRNLRLADLMNQRYLADKYLRCHEREKAMTALLQGGIPLEVYGNGWGDFVAERTREEAALFREMGTVDFNTSIKVIASAQVLLHVQPRFTHGIHDRITAAMLNHTPCLSDGTTYLREKIMDEKEILYYDKCRLEKLPEQALRLLQDGSLRERIAENGYQKARREYSWDTWVEKFQVEK